MTTLLQRIDKIRELRAEAGKPLSLRALAGRSGLAPTHLGTLVKRLRENPNATIEMATLVAIARGGGVSERWLARGEGDPELAEPAQEPDRYPNRARAIALARMGGADERAISWSRTVDPRLELDRETAWWLSRIMLRHAELEDLATPPPRRRSGEFEEARTAKAVEGITDRLMNDMKKPPAAKPLKRKVER